MTIFERLLKIKSERGAGYFVLIDPGKIGKREISSFVREATEAGVDGFLVGGSLMLSNHFDEHVHTIKRSTSVPVVIFPGGTQQLSPHADAILFLILISGRNPEYLIGNQVIAAPIIKSMGLEALATGYMLIESGNTTSVEFISNTKPIPRSKSDIAIAHALAAEYMGMKCLYLDAGSGADLSVPETMIQAITKHSSLPVIVGGGIRTPEDARRKVQAGASFVVTGTITEQHTDYQLLRDIAKAIHSPTNVKA